MQRPAQVPSIWAPYVVLNLASCAILPVAQQLDTTRQALLCSPVDSLLWPEVRKLQLAGKHAIKRQRDQGGARRG